MAETENRKATMPYPYQEGDPRYDGSAHLETIQAEVKPSIVDVARCGWDVARRAQIADSPKLAPWDDLSKEMKDALAHVATQGWLQGLTERK